MSLHTTTDAAKRIIFGIAITIGAIIFLIIVVNIIKSLIPKKVLPPNIAFGKLPPINFPTPTPDPSGASISVSYTLETVSGTYPILAAQEPVYEIAQPQPDLLALNNIQALLSQNDYPDKPQEISDTQYQWTSPNPPFKIFTDNTLTKDFSLTSSYATDPDVISAVNLGDQPGAIDIAKSFLTTLNGYPTTLDTSKTKTSLYSINATTRTLQPAISLSTAQIIQVDYFQKDLNKLPIYYPDPAHSLISVLVGSGATQSDVVGANFTYRTSDGKTGTYPIKTAQQAFTELQHGTAYIASPANPAVSPVIIRTISLGYYIGQNSDSYVMPIIVLQGDNGFYAYVNAIPDTYIQK